jgi:hypothetical protein
MYVVDACTCEESDTAEHNEESRLSSRLLEDGRMEDPLGSYDVLGAKEGSN